MSFEQAEAAFAAADGEASSPLDTQDIDPVATPIEEPSEVVSEEPKPPATPAKGTQKPLPKAPAMTPRIKKKIPWKGKNILVLLPRDEDRGRPGHPPRPMRQHEIEGMFESWDELGYDIDGFDHYIEEYQVPGTDDSQSRDTWPNLDDVSREREDRKFKVTLPDLNAWQNYVMELQEEKLRALGVSLAPEEPEPVPSPTPPESNPSRQPSAQYPALPFSPPIPTSSASSNHAIPGMPFQPQLMSGNNSGTASPAPFGKFDPRASLSFPAGASPFQPQQWQNLQAMSGPESPSLMNLNGVLSPHSPFGADPFQLPGSPAFGMHGRQQSLQYPLLPHQLQLQHQQQQQQQQQAAMPAGRLHDVREDEEEHAKSPSKTPEPPKQNSDSLQAEIDDAEHLLDASLVENLLLKDNGANNANGKKGESLAAAHDRQASGNLNVSEHFASTPGKPMVLHHPRPHSRGHSLTQNVFRDQNGEQDGTNIFAPMQNISEGQRADESFEIQTNPSNLGTPVQDFEFAGGFNQHQKNMSTASNPWNDGASAMSNGSRRPSHGSKPSLSKLNVKAPEFKFDPTSSFKPGAFNFSPAAMQPAVFQQNKQSAFHASAPSFAPGRSDFNFSALGPKFNPGAPSFQPFQSLSESVTSAGGSGSDAGSAKNSIFGNIEINPNLVKPAKKNKAIPIVRPSSRASAKSVKLGSGDEEADDKAGEVADNDSKKRMVKTAAADGDDVPLFAERPAEPDHPIVSVEEPSTKKPDEENNSAAEDAVGDAETTLPADTSMSSAITSDNMDTKATTAAASETSPRDRNANNWAPFEFQSPSDVQNFNQSRPFGEDRFKDGQHEKSMSATAPEFVPAMSAAEPVDDTPQPEQASDLAPPTLPEIRPETPLISLSPKLQPATSKGLGSSRFAPKAKGLAASRFAASSPAPTDEEPSLVDATPDDVLESVEKELTLEPQGEEQPQDILLPSVEEPADATFEEIDAVMQQLENEPSMGVKRSVEPSPWSQVTETQAMAGSRALPEESAAEPTPPPEEVLREDSVAEELEDPFVDPPLTPPHPVNKYGEPEQDSVILSDWEAAFTEDEHDKLESRAQFFDGRVNQIVGTLLASRLEPLEKTLMSIQDSLTTGSRRAPSSRRDIRSMSIEPQESDADDEDEEPLPRRSLSPRKDRKMEQIRIAVMEALATQERGLPALAAAESEVAETDKSSVLQALEELKQQFGANLKLDFRGEDLRNIVEEAVQSRMLPTPDSGDDKDKEILMKMDELQAKVIDLEERLYAEQAKVEKEVTDRRAADDVSAELNRKLQAAETRVEVEIINRSVFDQRVADLEERLRHQEEQTEDEVKQRRMAEDRLSEVQRLLRISSEEESRLRETLEEREDKIKTIEQEQGKKAMRMTLLEAAQTNSTQSQSEMTNKVNALEADLRNVRQDNNHWRAEAERADENAHRAIGERGHVMEENKRMQKSLDTMMTQLEENERLRESWRAKFMSLQEDMSRAARDIAEENASRIKKDQAMLARQEVLDARLQAEAKTRERLEIEMERLQMNERSGMRALSENKRLEGILAEMRTENHKLQQNASHYQREFEEARESGASEVKRTRMALQTEIDAANHQVNIIREELEEQNSKLRGELDNFKLSADTVKAQNEMLLEEAHSNKAAEIDELKVKHQNDMEDVHTRHERELNNAVEDGQKTEQNLLERLSISSSKIEHLQDKIVHLEDKLEIAKEAAAAAAAAAKSAGVEPGPAAAAVREPKPIAAPAAVPPSAHKMELPEKISPQALRESIMVLQEQLQAREQRIEELEQTVSKLDPEAPTKISKRDDEISWLRELLAVRHGDMQDIITALSGEKYDRERVKDATIRLKANLQMEEQERERAMNGGSAITLPNIAQSLQAATPRVAQSIGQAWGNWRRATSSNQPPFRSISGALNSPGAHSATPSKSTTSRSPNNLLGGLMTPPTSGLRQTPQGDNKPQPTAFASTGRRFPSQAGMSSRSRGFSSTSHQSEKMPARDITSPPVPEEPEAGPSTPPMMGSTAYDSDAQPGDFDDDGFFEED